MARRKVFFECGLRQQRGLGLIGWLMMIPVALVALLILAVAFYEGRKAYWDYRVREMCEEDGGIIVYERTTISAKRAGELPKIEGSISIPHKALAKLIAPLVSTDSEKILREWGPRVVRRERLVTRQSDGTVVGKIVSYSRIGGDFPAGISEGSSLTCPEYKKLYAEQTHFFLIEEAK